MRAFSVCLFWLCFLGTFSVGWGNAIVSTKSTLEAELVELSTLIALQQQKVQVLTELNTACAEDAECTFRYVDDSGATAQALLSNQARVHEVQQTTVVAAAAAAAAAVVGSVPEPTPYIRAVEEDDDEGVYGTRFDEMQLRAKWEIPTEADSCSVIRVLSLRAHKRDPRTYGKHAMAKKKIPVNLSVAVAGCGSTLRLWHIPTDDGIARVYEEEVHFEGEITSLAVSFKKLADPRYLMVGLTTGEVYIYMVAAWAEQPEILTGKEAPVIRAALQAVGNTPAFQQGSNDHHHQDDENNGDTVAVVSDVYVHQRQRYAQMIVGYEDGSIRVFTKNGTMRSSLQTNITAPIQSLDVSSATHSNSPTQRLAFIVGGSHVGTVRLAGKRIKIGLLCSCGNITEAITSVAWDKLAPNVLLAGTAEGTWVQLSSLSIKQNHCGAKFTIPVQEGSPITLNTEAGYVLAASVDAVYVFNVSTLYQTQGNPIFVGKRELYYAEHEETSNHDQQQKQQHRPLSVHTTASFKGQKWVVALAQDGRSAVGYEAFFYYSEDVDFDFLSLRGPLFVMGLIAVFIWNLYKKKQNGGGGSGGRGRGGPDQLPQDLMRQFEQMEQKFKSSQLTAGRGNRLGRTPRGY